MKSIWAKNMSHEKNVHVAYLYTLKPNADTYLELAASNLYRLFVDGAFVGYGPARAAHGYSRLDKYALADWAGKEIVIAVEVYSANVNSYYTVFEQPFFAAQIKCGENIIAQSHDFTAYHLHQRVQKVRRFSFQRAFSEIYHMERNPAALFAGDTTGWDPVDIEPVAMNKLLPRYVSYPKLDKLPALEIAHGWISLDHSVEPWHDRAYSEVDNIAYRGFLPCELEEDIGDVSQFVYHEVEESTHEIIGAMSYKTYDFGRTLTGFFSMDITVETDTTLYIVFNEVIENTSTGKCVPAFRDSCSNVIKYTLSAGYYHLQNFEANSARFASLVVITGKADIKNFAMIVYENPDTAAYKYDFGDPDLNRIFRAAINTFAQNAVDVLTDCPSRERAGWLCDSYFSARTEALLTGDNLVEKSFLENYALCHQAPCLPEGMIPMCYPADHFDGIYIPNWSMWYILELRKYFNRTGDKRMREISKEKVLGLVEFFKKYENDYGLLENLESCVYVECSKCNDPEYTAGVNYPSNMLWASALEAAAELYDLPELSEKAKTMRRTIRDLAWNGSFFEENAIRDQDGKLVRTGHTTETGQYYAFYFDVASPETDAELFEKMRVVFGPKRDVEQVYPQVYPSNAIVGNYLRLELLLRYSYKTQVLQECKDFFLYMADLTGTLWEYVKDTASLNHGFASIAAVYIEQATNENARWWL